MTIFVRTPRVLLGAGCAVIAAACASVPPPKELVDAREAYRHAEADKQTAELAAVDLHTAKEALDRAEKGFDDDAKSEHTRDLAYVAQRKAQTAEANGARLADERARADAQSKLQQNLASQTKSDQGELAKTREQIAREQQARSDAERKAAETAEAAARLAASKQQRPALNVNGSVLFGSGESTLTTVAQDKLNALAQAVREREDVTLLVEGFTDNSRKEKGDLAGRRAQVARDYLISRGIPPERITTNAVGSVRPVADNKTAEGRANNRRVEVTAHSR